MRGKGAGNAQKAGNISKNRAIFNIVAPGMDETYGKLWIKEGISGTTEEQIKSAVIISSSSGGAAPACRHD
jgi:hypothetical protein